MATDIAPNPWTARGIWAAGGIVFGSALATLGVELIGALSFAMIALGVGWLWTLRRWAQ